MARRTAILGYARTPIGRLMGGLSTLPATELGAHAIKAALERAGVAPEHVDHVIMGQVLQAGAGQVPSRTASVRAGLPVEVTTETINKVCASGHRAVTLGDVLIRAGLHDVVVAGGMESMSQAPHMLLGSRGGHRMGDATLVDAMLHDGLTDAFTRKHMVVSSAEVADELNISRERQDEWAARSQQRAGASGDLFAAEIAPVTITGRKGDIVVDTDESPRPETTVETLAKLKPIMKTDGTITAGNAPGVNDAGAALVLAGEDWAEANGHTPMAWLRGHAYVAGESPYLAVWPAKAILKLLEQEGLEIGNIDRIEVNEAFASVAVNTIEMIGADPDRVNVTGGAIALGHPIGMSGARIIGSLVVQLQRLGGGLGIAALCSGGGQGDAVLVEVPKG